MPKIIRNEVEYSSTTSTANQINYLNTTSGLSATNVQGAIDEVNGDLLYKRLTFVVPIDAISAGQSKSITATAAGYSVPSGYKAVSYYVQYCYGTNTRYLNIWSCNLDASGSSNFIEIQNIGSGATTSGATVTLVVLFVKSSRVSTT